MGNVAAIYTIQNCYGKAEVMLLESLKLQRRLLGDEHTEVAAIQSNLSHLYAVQGFYEKAKSFGMKALEIFKQKLGSEHPHTIIHKQALEKINQSLTNYRASLPRIRQTGNFKKKRKNIIAEYKIVSKKDDEDK
jgi:tetratricopeptide (TPR) repeat protein